LFKANIVILIQLISDWRPLVDLLLLYIRHIIAYLQVRYNEDTIQVSTSVRINVRK